jgi:hypothetical protein
VVAIHEIPSPRWDLALETLADGGPMTVLDCDPPVGLQRYAGWPGADGRIHVSLFTELEPHVITREIAAGEVKAGLEQLGLALAADARLQVLFDKHGVSLDYVYDYGHGAVRIGHVTASGRITLI